MDYLRLGGTAFAPTGDMRRAVRSRAGRVVVAVILAGTATVSWGASDSPMTGELEPSGIRQLLGSKSPGSPSDHPIIAETLRRFYEDRDHRHAWIDGEGLNSSARVLVTRVSRARREGLAPLRSLPEVVDSLLEHGDVDRVDVLLTEVFLTYGLLLGRGQVAPEAVYPGWHAGAPPDPDLLGALTAAADGDVDGALDGLAPSAPSYRQLRAALGQYLDIEAAGGWTVVPGGPLLKHGDTGARVRHLRQRLRMSGDIATSRGESVASHRADQARSDDTYDDELTAGVRRFQARHGLQADGVVGPATLEALNVPVSTRVRQIALNMERHRWLGPLAARRVSVNIAAQRLTVFDNDEAVMQMRVIMGRAYTPTPVLADRISHIVVNPYWHVPRSIAAEDILPEIKKEPGRLLWRGLRIFTAHDDDAEEVPPWMIDWAGVDPDGFPHVLRQDPGAENPLGRLKFMFANRFGVYLHDTPATELFDGADRARSHGCVRVERPLALAAFALSEDPRWDRDAIEKAVANGERRRIDLPRELPIYLLYWTAWGEPDGGVSFREDLYGFDERLTLALMGLAP